MKTILFLLLCALTFCLPFKNRPSLVESVEHNGGGESAYSKELVDSLDVEMRQVSKPAFAEATAGKTDTISFAAQIQPILQIRCNPCHFPGGKMYEKMPFDQAKTVVEHPEGILKRIKDEKESGLFKQFLAEAGK